MPEGPLPTAMVATTFPVAGSILETVASRLFATQTASRVTASATGPPPTSTVASVLPDGPSISVTRPDSWSATQTDREATARAAGTAVESDGPANLACVLVDLKHGAIGRIGHPQAGTAECDRRCIRATQVQGLRDLSGVGRDARERPRQRAGDPHRATAHRDAARLTLQPDVVHDLAGRRIDSQDVMRARGRHPHRVAPCRDPCGHGIECLGVANGPRGSAEGE